MASGGEPSARAAGAPSPPRAPRGDRRHGAVRRALLALIARLHRWAESGHAGSAVCTWNALQGSVVPGPSEALLVPLGLADPPRAPRLAAWAALGAIAGGLAAYAIGLWAFDTVGQPLLELFGVGPRQFARLEGLFRARGAWLILLSTVSPLSTKLTCIGAGAFGMPFLPFLGALVVGRAARFAVVGWLVRVAGDRMLAALERRLGKPIDEVR
jgi:membrane protein YqaA with SNARE-associated domain